MYDRLANFAASRPSWVSQMPGGAARGIDCGALLDTKVPDLMFLAVSLSFIPVMMMYGPAPFISTWLFATYKSTVPIGIYISICAVISIAATLLLRDHTNKDIALEHQYDNV
jgi:hypothetical protein